MFLAHLRTGAWVQEQQAVAQCLASLKQTVDTVIANLEAADPTVDAAQLAAALAQLASLKQQLGNEQAQ
jgi:predicted negative regulator of RcsB-dependent stress response